MALMPNVPHRRNWANHWLVAKTAREIATAFYEEAAKDNVFFKLHPNQRRFVEAFKHNFVRPARKALAKMLADPKIPEENKRQIHEALVLDRKIPSSFRGGQPTGGIRRGIVKGALYNAR